MKTSAATDQELSTIEWARWRSFALMSRRVTSAVESRLQRDAGISGADFEILDALAKAPSDKARARELAEMLSWEKSRISHQVTRMVERGLVRRSECDVDLRGSWVELTGAGRDALDRALPHYAAAVREVYLSQLSAQQATQVAQSALRVVTAVTSTECQAEVNSLTQSLDS